MCMYMNTTNHLYLAGFFLLRHHLQCLMGQITFAVSHTHRLKKHTHSYLQWQQISSKEVSGQLSVDCSGMQGAHRHTAAGDSLSELAREHDVCQFAATVGQLGSVAFTPHHVFKVEIPHDVR